MMKTIACLAAVALAGIAAPAGLGCRGADAPPRGAADPPPATAPATAAAPSPAPTAPPPQLDQEEPPAAPSPKPSQEYAGDIEKLCDVVRRSGADELSGDARLVPIAQWLAANLTTLESRQFLARIQPLGGDQKADVLEAEARRVGLPRCDLAAEWRDAPPL